MRRQSVTVGPHKFIVDLYDWETMPEKPVRKFVMLRRWDVMNGVSYDTDVYFIDKALFMSPAGTDGKSVLWPFSNTARNEFSRDFTDFNSDFTEQWVRADAYDLFAYDSQNRMQLTDVHCDKVRIYHPKNKISLNGAVHFDNWINNIHFHYYCREYERHDRGAETEFRIGNDIYSEYIEFLIPDVSDLFSGRVYYKEDMDSIDVYMDPILREDDGKPLHYLESFDPDGVSEGFTFIALERSEYNRKHDYVVNTPDATFCTVFMFSVPFKIVADRSGKYEKRYLPDAVKELQTNCLSYPLTVTLFPFDTASEDPKLLADSTLPAGSDVFHFDRRFSLSAKFGFAGGAPAVLTRFEWPNPELHKSFSEAYEYYNCVSLDEYSNIEIDLDTGEPYDDDSEIRKQCGFEITVASDPGMKNVISRKYVWDDAPDDFAFPLSDVFSAWEEMPELIVCQTVFTDRWLGIKMPSNPVVITKEKYKYLVNDADTSRIMIDKDKFAFIDKVQCTVVRDRKEQAAPAVPTASGAVLYKPVFYRVNDLQNIKLRSGVVQNIGVNLGDYMSKVQTFVMKIGGASISEYARNDVFVIFSVHADAVSGNAGKYDITTQDDEYVSSGNWIKE